MGFSSPPSDAKTIRAVTSEARAARRPEPCL